MELPTGGPSSEMKQCLKTPKVVAKSNTREDSGYSSPFEETKNEPSENFEVSDCFLMEVDSAPVLGSSDIPEKQVIDRLGTLSKVWESTPVPGRACKDLQAKFHFETPLSASKASSMRQKFFDGLPYFDIVTNLADMGITPALEIILSKLDPKELCIMKLVSKSWTKVLGNSSRIKDVQQYVKISRQNKENIQSSVKADHQFESTTTPSTSRSQLQDINNIVRTPVKKPPLSPPVSPTKLKFSRYIKESKKLKIGQRLLKCPKCDRPSHTIEKRALCTNINCEFSFCVECRGPFHENIPCRKTTSVTPTKTRSRVMKVGSQKSKRNLQRCLL